MLLMDTEVQMSALWGTSTHLNLRFSSDPAADEPTQLTICDSVVWGTMAIGGGHMNIEELFATIRVRSIDQKTLAKKENVLGQVRIYAYLWTNC